MLHQKCGQSRPDPLPKVKPRLLAKRWGEGVGTRSKDKDKTKGNTEGKTKGTTKGKANGKRKRRDKGGAQGVKALKAVERSRR